MVLLTVVRITFHRYCEGGASVFVCFSPDLFAKQFEDVSTFLFFEILSIFEMPLFHITVPRSCWICIYSLIHFVRRDNFNQFHRCKTHADPCAIYTLFIKSYCLFIPNKEALTLSVSNTGFLDGFL